MLFSSALYPDLSQGGTDSGLHPHSGSSLSDYSPQHSPHSYFHVIIISAYPAVRVKFYAYVNMLGRNDLKKTNLLFAGKESSLQTCNNAKGRNQRRNNANDSFGKGFHVLKDHVLNR